MRRAGSKAAKGECNRLGDRGFGRPSTAVILEVAEEESPEEEQRRREFRQRLLKDWEDMIEHARKMEQRAIAAESQLAALSGSAPHQTGEHAHEIDPEDCLHNARSYGPRD